MINRFASRFVTIFVLCLMFGLVLHSVNLNAPTMDEQGFLVRGLAYLRGNNRWMRVGHPAGLNVLNASLLWLDETVTLPTDDPSWQETSFHRPAELFLWERGNNVQYLMFLGRLPTVFLGLLLACLIGRFAFDLTKRSFLGVLALTITALDPNILAHSGLITTDLGLVVGVVLATWLLWRYWQAPSWRNVLFAGIAFGLLQNTKFTALLFVPLFALVILIGLIVAARQKRPVGAMVVQLLVGYVVVSLLTLWACYGFNIGRLPSELPAFSGILGGKMLPFPHYLEQLADIGNRATKSTPAFLWGDYSDRGWWYYFPITFAVKTPLPSLLLLVDALLIGSIIRSKRNQLFGYALLLIPSLGYLAIGMSGSVNIGYRHILLLVPFIALIVAYLLRDSVTQAFVRWMTTIFALWLIAVTWWNAPDFLSYFNLIAGGSANGWRVLVDSNLDWGQSLPSLATWMKENDVPSVRLSYFGESRPEYYGINYTGLPSFPPRLAAPDAIPHYPNDPAPGVYAISATNLQGVMFDNHDQFAWFRDKKPRAVLRHSIFLYDVAERGDSADIALGSLPLDQISLDDYAQLGGNQPRYHWFDATQALLLPPVGNWIGIGRNSPHNLLQAIVDQVTTSSNTLQPYQWRRVVAPLPEVLKQMGLTEWEPKIWRNGESAVTFYHSSLFSNHDVVQLATIWQQKGDPAPLQIFVHLLDEQGQLIAQWDGLGARWQSWQKEDWLVQWSEIPLDPSWLPQDGTQRRLTLQLGLYDPATGQRWLTDGVESLPAGEVTLP